MTEELKKLYRAMFEFKCKVKRVEKLGDLYYVYIIYTDIIDHDLWIRLHPREAKNGQKHQNKHSEWMA